MPTYGRSTYRGQSISNAFFWAISRSQDATFFHDWFLSRGQGVGSEYRYIESPQSQGNFRFYCLERERERPRTASRTPTRSRLRRCTANVTQELPAGAPRRGRASTTSRTSPRSSSTTTTCISDLQHALVRRRRVWRVEGAQRLGPATSGPRASTTPPARSSAARRQGSRRPTAAAGSGQLPVYASLTTDLSRVLWQQKSGANVSDFGLGKFDLFPSVRAPLSRLPFLSVNTSFAYRMTYFTESVQGRQQVEEPVTRRYADMRGRDRRARSSPASSTRRTASPTA